MAYKPYNKMNNPKKADKIICILENEIIRLTQSHKQKLLGSNS